MPSSALIDSECQIDRRQFLTGAPRYSVFQKLHPIGEGGGEDKTLELVALMNEEVSLSLLYPAYWYTDQSSRQQPGARLYTCCATYKQYQSHKLA